MHSKAAKEVWWENTVYKHGKRESGTSSTQKVENDGTAAQRKVKSTYSHQNHSKNIHCFAQ